MPSSPSPVASQRPQCRLTVSCPYSSCPSRTNVYSFLFAARVTFSSPGTHQIPASLPALLRTSHLPITPGKEVKVNICYSVDVFTWGPGGLLTPQYWINVTRGIWPKFPKVETYSTEILRRQQGVRVGRVGGGSGGDGPVLQAAFRVQVYCTLCDRGRRAGPRSTLTGLGWTKMDAELTQHICILHEGQSYYSYHYLGLVKRIIYVLYTLITFFFYLAKATALVSSGSEWVATFRSPPRGVCRAGKGCPRTVTGEWTWRSYGREAD